MYYFFFFFFGGQCFWAACFAQLPCWGVRISSAWYKDNDLTCPRMGKIIIYHVQLRSELFRTTLRTKLRNVIRFDSCTSFAYEWRVSKWIPTRNKDNPLNSFASGRFPKETSRIMIRTFLESWKMHIKSIKITLAQLKKRTARAKFHQILLICGQIF